MATGADLGVEKCLWATCPRKMVELVESSTGAVHGLCAPHAVCERAIAKREREEREARR